MTERQTSAITRLRASMRLLEESLVSYETHGTRSIDKVVSDAQMVVSACFGVAAEIGRKS